MTRGGATNILTGAAFLFLAAIFAVSQYRDLTRAPSVDEAEYLHGAARMARGDRIFVDFVEHHPPLFFGMVSLLAGDDVFSFVARARLFAGLCAAIAIASAAFLVYRASGRVYAPLIFIALLLGANGIWRNGLGDIRPEGAALALWWGGAALVVLARHPALRGLGIGLVFVSAVVVPKWPFESAVIGIVFLARVRWAAMAVAIATAAVGVTATAFVADLDRTYFFVVTLTRAMWHGLPASGPLPFYGCPQPLRPYGIAVTLLVVLWARFRAREAFDMPRLVELFAALTLASFLEIRFLYYPAIDFRYWVMWSFGAAALLALLAQSAAAILERAGALARRFAVVPPVVLTAIALLLALEHIGPRRSKEETYWRWSGWMASRMGPTDTVWVSSRWHPIGARDASYYWFGADNVIPAAQRLAPTEAGRRFLPPVTEDVLPPCAADRGAMPNLLFLGDPGPPLPRSRECFARLRARGAIERTPLPEVWMVRRRAATIPLPP